MNPFSSKAQDPTLKYRTWREQLSLFLLLANNFQSHSPKQLNHFNSNFPKQKETKQNQEQNQR